MLAAGVSCLAMGMALAFFGILLPGLFLPGTWLILIGLLGCAGAGLAALLVDTVRTRS